MQTNIHQLCKWSDLNAKYVAQNVTDIETALNNVPN